MVITRKSAGLTAAAVLGLLAMTACGAQPQVDLQDAEAWFGQVDDENSSGTFLGGQTVTGDHDELEASIRSTLDGPTDVTKVESSCFGDGRATIVMEISYTDGYRSFNVDIPCDGEPHEISDAVGAVNKVGAGGYTSDGEGTYYAVVVHES